jgi:hypothetical protein
MALWRFFNYITEHGDNLIADWYDAQDPEVQAQFDATLFLLGATEDWGDEKVMEFKPLTGKHVGLGEIRFHVIALAPGAKRPHRRRFRPVGIWPPRVDHEFVLILGCEKSGRTFIPHNAFDLALNYKSLIEQGRGTISERI